MSGEENRAEVFLRAFDSLPKIEKQFVASRLLDDPQLREAVLELGGVRECEAELARPPESGLAERGANEG